MKTSDGARPGCAARTRERLPALLVLVRSVDQRRSDAAALLEAARNTDPSEAFTAAGQQLVRAVVPHVKVAGSGRGIFVSSTR
ncbi:hypothetical protein ACWD3Z_41455 [Streptomyces sp. NPDC002740]